MDYDQRHRLNIAKYASQMDAAFKSVIDQVSNYAGKYQGAFKFDKKADKIFFQLSQNVESIIKSGMTEEWSLSNEKNNALVKSYIKNAKALDKAGHFLQPNVDALEAYINREVNGMNLSKRVWNIVGMYKDELEAHVGIGILNGDSSSRIATRTKQYLKNPDALFRRVRDEKGNLRLSKRAQDYHPGQGIYRSAYMNGYRLTVSETNMSYREADYLRWQQLDFVTGIKVSVSAQHWARMPQGDICDMVQGVYPKSFKFSGWHTLCFCRATAIMLSDDEYDAFENALLEGKRYSPKKSINYVGDVPEGFKSWILQNKDRISGWKSKPYFIQDNFKYGNITKGLRVATTRNISATTSLLNGKITGSIANIDDVHAITSSYAAQYPDDFARGFRSVSKVTDNSYMMATNSYGDIWVSDVSQGGFNPFQELVEAFKKIQSGSKLTFENEYAIESFYHEILHNKAILHERLPKISIGHQRASMEVVNQFIARNDYRIFLERIGGKAYHQPKILDDGLGYQHWIDNFRDMVERLKLDEKKLLPELRSILLEKRYSEIDSNLIDLLSKESGIAKSRIEKAVHFLKEPSSRFITYLPGLKI